MIEPKKIYRIRPCVYCGKEPKYPPKKNGLCYKCGKKGFKEIYAKGELPEKENTRGALF